MANDTRVKIELPKKESDNYKWKALATVALGTFMGTMDAGVTNISFPALTKTFNTDLATIMWVALAYMLTSTSLMLVVGRVGDMVGRKKIYSYGNLIFFIGITICSLAQNVEQLILFRIFQAVGAAMIISCGTAIITEAFPSHEIGKAMGLIGMSVSAGFILGPVFGGVLLETFGWRSIFYIRAPIGFLSWILSMILLHDDSKQSGGVKLDYPGAITSSISLALIVFGVSLINKLGIGAWQVWSIIFAGFFCLVIFIILEKRHPAPVMDMELFKNKKFFNAALTLLVTFTAYPTMVLVLPFFLIVGVGISPVMAGPFIAAVSLVSFFVGPVAGSLSDRYGQALFAPLGAITTGVSFLAMMRLSPDSGPIEIIFTLALLGLGIGLFQPANNSSMMSSVSQERLGSASALLATLRSVGIAVGMALIGTVYSVRQVGHLSDLTAQGLEAGLIIKQASTMAFRDSAFISGLIALSVVGITLLIDPDAESASD